MKYTLSYNKSTITLDTVTGKITGDTYQMRTTIKEDFPGAKWNKEEKCWEYADIEGRINEYRDYFTRCYKLAAEAPAAEAEADTEEVEAPATLKESKPSKPTTTHDAVISRITGLCPRCGTYCYGDCSFR